MNPPKKKDLSIIIPSFNEIKNLNILCNKVNKLLIKNKNIEIIIVENGSTDGSKNFIKINKKIFSKIKFIDIKKNIGYGHGIKCGLKFATGKVISWTHADLQIDIDDIIHFFNKNSHRILKKKIIIKGRRINRSLFNILFTKGMSFFVNFFFNVDINDINAQPKIFPNSFVNKILKFAPNDFTLDLFLLLLVAKNNHDILEFPLRFNKRLHGDAKGGGTIIGKIKLTIATLKYIYLLKINLNYKLWK